MDPRDLENFSGVPKELPKYGVEENSDKISLSLEKKRLNVCNTCEHKVKMFTVDTCDLCKCWLSMKAKFKFSKCPAGKWENITED